MKNRLMIFAIAGILALGGLVYGIDPSQTTCPLEGTPDCPKNNCPLAGTPDCPYEIKLAELPSCCKRK